MSGRNKGWHPSIWAAIITGTATIIAVIVTVVLNQPTPQRTDTAKAEGNVLGSVAEAPVRLDREYNLRKDKNCVQFLFDDGKWRMATTGEYRGSMGGTYRVSGARLTLIVERSNLDMSSIQSPFTMRLDELGVLHMDGSPSWALVPRGN